MKSDSITIHASYTAGQSIYSSALRLEGYPCPLCARPFKSSQGCRRHLRDYHTRDEWR